MTTIFLYFSRTASLSYTTDSEAPHAGSTRTLCSSANLTETAQLMGYTQSGITRMIDTLERELGFKILVRSNKGVTLTENGKTMLPLFREIVLACRNAEELASDIRGVLRGNVTIGTYYSAATIILPKVIKSFSEKNPGIKVDMQVSLICHPFHMVTGLREKNAHQLSDTCHAQGVFFSPYAQAFYDADHNSIPRFPVYLPM